jgi:hypothetical protein
MGSGLDLLDDENALLLDAGRPEWRSRECLAENQKMT